MYNCGIDLILFIKTNYDMYSFEIKALLKTTKAVSLATLKYIWFFCYFIEGRLQLSIKTYGETEWQYFVLVFEWYLPEYQQRFTYSEY